MIESLKASGAKRFFLPLLVFIIVTNLAILLNIPFLRQILGFIFLTILPGLLILQILKLNKIGSTEKFVLSVGLSISFLLLYGLLINKLSLSFGYETPLFTSSILISFNLAFIIFAILGYKLNTDPIFSFPKLNLTISEKAFLIFPIFFPALSILGMHVMNTTDNNIITLFLLFLIPVYVVSVCLFNQKFSNRLYPIIIFLTALSIVLMLALRSYHIIGMDTHEEYSLFYTTLSNHYWDIFGHNALDACLSISLLPTIFQSVLGLSPEFLFKILYALILSVSPLIVYIISKKYVSNFYAFLASFFFMSQPLFLSTTSNARTNLAILFFALAIMILIQNDLKEPTKKLLLIIFAVSCILSHYSTAFIFLAVLIVTLIGMGISKLFINKSKFVKNKGRVCQAEDLLNPHYLFKNGITITIALLYFVVIFFWYSQVTKVPFDSGVIFIHNTMSNLNQFFVLESRGGELVEATGSTIAVGRGIITQKIKFVVYWLTIVYIAIGLFYTVLRYERRVSIPLIRNNTSNFLKTKIDTEYFMLSSVCVAILVISVILPYVFAGYNMGRAYFQMMPVLSFFFVIGGISLSKFLKLKSNWSILVLLIILIPYFMCTTDTVGQIFGVPGTIILNSKGGEYDFLYVHDEESVAAKWLKENGGVETAIIYSDFTGDRRLKSQGGFPWSSIDLTYSLLDKDKKIGGYIYLRYANIAHGKLYDRAAEGHRILEYKDKFIGKGKIYNNGGAEVWK